MKSCLRCAQLFEIFSEDQELYAELDVPEPDLCPNCREQSRLLWRNERSLYRRTCDLCQASVISIFSAEAEFPVYCPQCWWSDQWTAADYGAQFDFSRPFFEQFYELQKQVPRLSLNNVRHTNSEYCNQCTGNKNCYLIFASDDNEDSYYSYWINRCTDVYNCSYLADCTLCFSLLDSEDCYGCVFSQDLKNCRDCLFCYDCIGCMDCIGCAGLRNQRYCIENTPYSPEEYSARKQQLDFQKYSVVQEWREKFGEIRQQIPHKYIHTLGSENCSGDYIIRSGHCFQCWDILGAENCRYSSNLVHQNFANCDVSYATEATRVFQGTAIIGSDIACSSLAIYSADIWHCDSVFNCQHLLGCIAMRNAKNCILNKQYTEEEYAELFPRIKAHMQQTAEWGKFFPGRYSPFAYNETVAFQHFPLSKERVQALGWRFKEVDPADFTASGAVLPDSVAETAEEYTKHTYSCAECQKTYRILPHELSMHATMKLAVPRSCSDCRYQQLQQLRNPRQFWKRSCESCQKELQSTYDPQRPERIYCEECYQHALV